MRPKANAQAMLKKAGDLFQKIGKKTLPNGLKAAARKYSLDEKIFSEFIHKASLESINEEFRDWISEQKYLSGGEAAYNKIDKDRDVYRLVHMGWPNKKKAPDDYFKPLIHPITKIECPVPDRGWRFPPKTMKKLLTKGEIVFGPDHTTQPQRKYLLKENMSENIPSILSFGGSDDKILKELGIDFENPKPHKFSKELLSYFTDQDSVILDSFAGSGTMAHAVLALNSEDGGNRRFIL